MVVSKGERVGGTIPLPFFNNTVKREHLYRIVGTYAGFCLERVHDSDEPGVAAQTYIERLKKYYTFEQAKMFLIIQFRNKMEYWTDIDEDHFINQGESVSTMMDTAAEVKNLAEIREEEGPPDDEQEE